MNRTADVHQGSEEESPSNKDKAEEEDDEEEAKRQYRGGKSEKVACFKCSGRHM